MRSRVLVLGVAGLLALSSAAMARVDETRDETPEAQESAGESDCVAPCLGYQILVELQNDSIFAAKPFFLKSNALQPTSTVDLFFAPTEYLRFSTSIVSEREMGLNRAKGAFLGGVGTYVSELYATVDADPVIVRLGKFDTIFSLASQVEPGMNQSELVSEIDADERLGAELAVGFDAAGLNQTLAATVFTTDATFLSASLFNNRGRSLLSSGRTENASSPASFSLVLDGCEGAETAECYLEGDFGYRAGIRYQGQMQTAAADSGEYRGLGNEIAYLAAVTRSFEMDDVTLRLLGETSYIRNLEGRRDDAVFVTGQAALELDPLTYTATYTRRSKLGGAGPIKTDHLLDFEVLWTSPEDQPFRGAKWTIGGAYTFLHAAQNENRHMISLRATFNLGGEVKLGQ